MKTLQELAASPSAAIELGKAAEYIACADVILQGYRCYPSDQGLPYDLVIDVGGRLLRVQVKSTSFAKNVNANGRNPRMAYSFHVRARGKGRSQRLSTDDCDIVACVALDVRIVAYLPLKDCGQTLQIGPVGTVYGGMYARKRWVSVDGLPLGQAIERALEGGKGLADVKNLGALTFDGQTKTLTDWSKQYGISAGLISGRLSRGWSAKDAITSPPDKGWRRKPNHDVAA